MKLLWPSIHVPSDVSDTLRKHQIFALASWYEQKNYNESYHVPLIINNDGTIVREAHEFLYDKAFYSNSSGENKTIKTYAECLVDWLSFAADNSIGWESASNRTIVLYRNALKGKIKDNGRHISSRTINLRLVVVMEFYKFYWSKVEYDEATQEIFRRRLLRLNATSLKVRVSKRRPRALTQDACNRIMQSLNGVHKVIFAWTLSTGMRIGSVLSITLEQFGILDAEYSGGFIEVVVKGAKTQKIYVPMTVIDETRRYALSTRELSLERQRALEESVKGLFINSKGKKVSSACYYAAYKRACVKHRIISHPHQARTTFATFMERKLFSVSKERGLDHVKIVQGLLGHASSTTTQEYLESISGSNVEVLRILDKHAVDLSGRHEK